MLCCSCPPNKIRLLLRETVALPARRTSVPPPLPFQSDKTTGLHQHDSVVCTALLSLDVQIVGRYHHKLTTACKVKPTPEQIDYSK